MTFSDFLYYGSFALFGAFVCYVLAVGMIQKKRTADALIVDMRDRFEGFHYGQRVRLKSGGPTMVIERVQSVTGEYCYVEFGIHVRWHDAHLKMQRAVVMPETLEIVT